MLRVDQCHNKEKHKLLTESFGGQSTSHAWRGAGKVVRVSASTSFCSAWFGSQVDLCFVMALLKEEDGRVESIPLFPS